MPESEVVRVMREGRAALLRQEGAQMRAMARRWLLVERRLMVEIDGVLAEIRRRQAAGEVFGADQGPYVRLARYRQLLLQVQREIGGYSRWVEQVVTSREAELVRRAVEQGQLAIEAAAAGAAADGMAVGAGFNRLPAAAVENMAASLSDGAPLRRLLAQAWPDAAVRMTDALVNGVALGWNPRKTARAMAEGLQQGALQRCLVIARTEQMRVYRQASLETYRASGVVRGYKRLAAKQERTCLSCLIEDGRFYELDEEFEEHPGGRCTCVPCLKGMPDPQWEKGRAWLERQPEAVQKQVMGPARWELWKGGGVSLDEMVERHEHPVWGGSLGVKAVKSLPGGPEALQRVYAVAGSRLAATRKAADNSKVAPHYQELQKIRRTEVRAMTPSAWQDLRRGMRQSNKLPKPKQHFAEHGREFEDLGVATQQQLEKFFAEHVQRPDLAMFTYVSTQKGTRYRHWALVGMDNGAVAVYNESKQRFWTFYRPRDFRAYMEFNRNWWVRVQPQADRPKVMAW